MNKAALNNAKQPINTAPAKQFKERPKIFVYRELDELGLDPYEFRLYSHIARRGNCFATLDKIAATCQMSVRKVQYALKVLEASSLIEKEKRNGRTNKFCLAPPSNWLTTLNAQRLEAIRRQVKTGKKLRSQAAKALAAQKSTGDYDPSDSPELDEGDVPY